MGSDYLFSLGDLRKHISQTALLSGRNPSQEGQGKGRNFRIRLTYQLLIQLRGCQMDRENILKFTHLGGCFAGIQGNCISGLKKHPKSLAMRCFFTPKMREWRCRLHEKGCRQNDGTLFGLLFTPSASVKGVLPFRRGCSCLSMCAATSRI